MATMTIYASSVTGAAWTNPNNAAGSPSAGNAVPYATEAIPAGNSDTLTAAFAATAVPGTITGVVAVATARSTVGSGDTEATFAANPLTFSSAETVAITNFALVSTSASASAASFATFKAAVIAGTVALDVTFSTTVGATVDAKGIGLVITYTPFNSIASKDSDDTLLITGTRR